MIREKRFTIEESENQLIIFDNGVSDETYFHLGNDERDVKYVCDLLNNQQDIIKKLQDLCEQSDSENAKLRIENKKLKSKLKEKEEDERLYANEILELRETNKEHIKFKSLGGNY